MRFLFQVLPKIFVLPIAIYLYFYIRRTLVFLKVDTKKIYIRIALIVLSLVIASLTANVWGIGFLIVMFTVAFSIVMDIVNLMVKKLSATRNKGKGIWSIIYGCGVVPVLCMVLMLGCGYWNMNHVVEKGYTIYTQKDIRDEGYRIALISDLHFGTTMSASRLQEYCDEIGSKDPDIVVLCGDIVDEATTLNQMKEAIAILSTIRNNMGIFYVYGNHDRATFASDAGFSETDLDKALALCKIHILADSSHKISDDFSVIGRQDRYYNRNGGRSSSLELLEEQDKNDFLLMLDHQPVALEENAAAGYDLQLSGHTHGGQIWPVGLISDLLGFGELNYGYEKIDDFQVIVSSGIAGWGYPVKTGAPAEYVIVDVKKQ